MAKSPRRPSPARPLRVAGFWPGLLLLCVLAPVALAKSSLRPITVSGLHLMTPSVVVDLLLCSPDVDSDRARTSRSEKRSRLVTPTSRGSR
ncbi:hypothetical protein BHE74_00058522 [Ensete ventricosum]|nr:hypothetical protein BHE74_00058522 [Ensete ventricosum]